MFKKVIGYTFLFYLLISLILSLSGVTSIDLMQSSNTFFRAVAQRFNSWGKWEIPNIPKITIGSNASGWTGILETLKALVNIIISVVNMLIAVVNILLQSFEFIGAIGSIILDSTGLFVSSFIEPTLIM